MMELLVMISIAGRHCALRAVDVQSVIELETVTPVPRAPGHICGLTTRRSEALTVIDCHRAIGLRSEPQPLQRGQRAAVVCFDGHNYALLVDRIDDVEEATSEVTGLAGGFGPEWTRIAAGMIETGKGPVLLLEIAQLIAGPDQPAVAP